MPGQVIPLRTIGLGRPLTFFVSPNNAGAGIGQAQPVESERPASFLPQGSEVTISYVGLAQPRSTRRSVLLSDYYFECRCERCVAEAVVRSTRRAKGNKGKSAKRT